MKIKNITMTEFLLSYIYGLNFFKEIFSSYQKSFRNYKHVLLNVLRKKYPIIGISKNGDRIVFNSQNELYAFTHDLDYDPKTGIAGVLYDNIKLKFFEGIVNGSLYEIFVKRAYEFLPVKNRIVIDIGANIGDSVVYFCIRGAKKVVALEPFPANYDLAKKNILINNFSSKVNLILGSCSSQMGRITLDPNKYGITTEISQSQKGKLIPQLTLEHILKSNEIASAVLKIDCECCEYDVILSLSKQTLCKFTHILIEYHNGYLNIKNKLEQNGFDVIATNPKFSYKSNTTKSLGLIFSTRKDY